MPATAVNVFVLGLIAGLSAIAGVARADTSETAAAAAESPMVAPVKRVAPRMPAGGAGITTSNTEPKKPAQKRSAKRR